MASIEISEEHGVRYLHFGSPWVQGAMRISRPWALELEYTREMMMPLVLRPEAGWPASVLQVGLGSASLTKFLHRHRPDAKLTVVEIAPPVVAAARQFFKLPEESRRLRIEIADGHEYIAATRRHFDLILVDAFDAKGRSGMLDSIPFYLNCRARLGDSGMFAVNILDRRKGAHASIERLRVAFDDRVLVLPPREPGNTIVIAACGPPLQESFDRLRASAAKLIADTGLNLLPALARLAHARGGKELVL
ncbi:MAG TPA: fused MFS/spermidine synthase [Usitatibacter sp.]